MKQFILKNIVLAVFLAITLVGSIFLIFFIWDKSRTIKESMAQIEEDVDKLRAIDSASRPNSVEQSEKMIKADTETLTRKKSEVYRNFGKPYRPALLKFIENISSQFELDEIPDDKLDKSLVAKPKPKQEEDADGDAEVAENTPSEPSAPTDEEKAVFDPASKRVILSFDEDTLRSMLADLYKDIHHDSSDDTFVIPDTIGAERAQLFQNLFDKIIEPPAVVDPSRAEAFRTAAAKKFARAFANFCSEIQKLTLEDVVTGDDYGVAHALFLDALGLPRLMRQRDCKNYVDVLYEKYLVSEEIPGLENEDIDDRTEVVRDFIYGKNLSRQALPVPEMVIPIIRNFQIKEHLIRKMKEAGITNFLSMNAGVFYGSTMENDADGAILVFTYTLEMVASMKAVDDFINLLHKAYKDGHVYVVKDIKFTAPYSDMVSANSTVESHMETPAAAAARKAAEAAAAAAAGQVIQPVVEEETSQVQYDLTDPRNREYGKTLIGEKRNNIGCTIVVDYLFYRADNITPQ